MMNKLEETKVKQTNQRRQTVSPILVVLLGGESKNYEQPDLDFGLAALRD